MASSATGGYRFLNPYNFVRWLAAASILPGADNIEGTELLGRCPPPPHDRWVGLNGVLDCTLEAVTPLFVSDSEAYYRNSSDRENDHRTYRFFHYDFGKGPAPALPASSLRGMLRGVFEAVTNSCYAHFDYGRRLSYHLPATESLKLVPARVEQLGHSDDVATESIQNDEMPLWQLRLLPGTARLTVGDRPRDMLYAARMEQYEAIRPAGRRPQPAHKIDLGGLSHGDICFALVERRKFPPVWNVVTLARQENELPRTRDANQRIVKGCLCLNNRNIETKRFERFFFRTGDNRDGPMLVPLASEVAQKYRELIDDYRLRHADAVAKSRERYDQDGREKVADDEPAVTAFSRFIAAENWRLKHGELVYAMLSGTTAAPRVEFIVPVAVPRVGYERMVGDLLPKHLWKCEQLDALCPACRTFGWVHGRGDEPPTDSRKIMAYASRLRFTHGRLQTSADHSLGPTPLAILSTPKPTTSRFYLKPASREPVARLDDYQAGYDNPNNVLRGRKVYRHHGRTGDVEYWSSGEREYRSRMDKQSDQSRTVEGALLPGAQFTFSIHFENLAPLELGALLWSLELGGQGFHRIGFGKALGFGSVRLSVQDVVLFQPSKRYSKDLQPGFRRADAKTRGDWVASFMNATERAFGQRFDDLPHVRDLLALLGEPPAGLPIHYPRTGQTPSPEGRNFEWFMGNNRNKEARFPLEVPGNENGLPLIDKGGNVKF